MSVALDTPYLEDGIRSAHFFNGRLLSGEDLTQERLARQAGLAQLGRAAGEGVAYGLLVSGEVGGDTVANPVVTVRKGLAVNRLGQPLELLRDLEVSLLASASSPASVRSQNGSGFRACSVVPSDYVAGRGVYLLLLAPARGREGRAPVSGISGGASCNAKYLVDGVMFRLLRLPVPAADLEDPARLRNRVAHLCFGSGDPKLQGALANPFGPTPEGYGLLDTLRPDTLTDCDVPLAVVHWTDDGGIRFVDNWSVRRRLAVATDGERFAPLLGQRRRSEAEAMFFQFQEQVEAMHVGSADLTRVAAVDRFSWLPPAGIIPMASGSVSGFDPSVFFAGITTRSPVPIVEGARLAPLVRQALEYPSFQVPQAGEPGRQPGLVWRYQVRENLQAGAALAGTPMLLLFASGMVPYAAAARFNVAHWEFGNYTSAEVGPGGD